jgi:hypothetical protein
MNRKPTRGDVKTAMNQDFSNANGKHIYISRVNWKYYAEILRRNGQHFIYLSVGKITKPKVKICFDRNFKI